MQAITPIGLDIAKSVSQVHSLMRKVTITFGFAAVEL